MDLIQAISRVAQIPKAEAEALLGICRHTSLSEGQCFIREGELPQKMAIVMSGLFRYVYVDDEGNEYTKSFMPEGSFLTSYSAMISGEPSYFSIEALEDAEVLVFSYRDWQTLLASNVVWKDLLIRMLEQGFSAKQRRERDLLLLDAETRYANFCSEHPNLLERVKQYQIASFLGIKPESLSRLKKSRA